MKSMIGFLRNKFHKFSYRIYMNGKNYYKKNVEEKIPGVSKQSNTRNLTVGQEVSFGGNVLLLGAGKITIGDQTMIAAGVTIHTSTHDHALHPMRTKRIDKDVHIGNHVWIGTGAIILPGVTVADYSVIGAGSLVNRDVEKGTIVVGNPAKKVKERDLKSLNLL